MDLPTESLVKLRSSGESCGRHGIALPSAMFALVAAGILAAGMFAFADLSAKATLNQERSTRAMHVAEAGLYHSVSLLRGSLRMHNFARIFRGGDNFIPNADDGTLTVGAPTPALRQPTRSRSPAGRSTGVPTSSPSPMIRRTAMPMPCPT